MTKGQEPGRRGNLAARREDTPLVRALIVEATRRGHTLAMLAKHLGVTYERLAQWRRHDFDMASANRQVLEAAARYLNVPTAYVLCLVGVVTLRDFVRPPQETLATRVKADMAEIRQDPYLAGMVPDALLHADPSVQLFVALLYRELGGGKRIGQDAYEWTRSLHAASLGADGLVPPQNAEGIF